MVSSATAAALRPGTLQTKTPRVAAASVSIVLVPDPARITSASRSAASNTERFTLVLRTTSPSKPAIRAGEVVGLEPGLHHADVPTGLEVGDRLLGQLVGEEQLHLATLTVRRAVAP